MPSSCNISENITKVERLEEEVKRLDLQRKEISARIAELNGGDPLIAILQKDHEDLNLAYNTSDAKLQSLKRSMQDKTPMLVTKRRQTEANLEDSLRAITQSRDPEYQMQLLASMRIQKNRQEKLDLAIRAEDAKKLPVSLKMLTKETVRQ